MWKMKAVSMLDSFLESDSVYLHVTQSLPSPPTLYKPLYTLLHLAPKPPCGHPAVRHVTKGKTPPSTPPVVLNYLCTCSLSPSVTSKQATQAWQQPAHCPLPPPSLHCHSSSPPLLLLSFSDLEKVLDPALFSVTGCKLNCK